MPSSEPIGNHNMDGSDGGTLDAQLLMELEACEISDAEVYVPFLRAMLDDADPLAEDAREALGGTRQQVSIASPHLALCPYVLALARDSDSGARLRRREELCGGRRGRWHCRTASG